MGRKSRYSSASASHSPLRTVELLGLLVLLWRPRRLNTLWVETSGAEISGERMKSSSGRYSGLLRVVNWLWPGLLHRAARGRFSVLHGTSATVVFPPVWEPLKTDWKALLRVWRCNEPCVSTHSGEIHAVYASSDMRMSRQSIDLVMCPGLPVPVPHSY